MAQTLVDWLHAEAPKREVYRQSPLALALCQVRFTTRFGLADTIVGAFQEALESKYPYPEQQQIASIQFSGMAGQVSVQAPTPGMQWQFVDDTGDWTVSLTSDFVTLETRAYENFNDFLERLRWVLEAIVSIVKPGFGRRIGLRYINEIQSAERDWAKMIRPEILGPLSVDPIRKNCDQAMQVVSLRFEDVQATLQHGQFPTGSTVMAKPGTPPGKDPFYLLDIDMYQEFGPPRSLRMDAASICRYIDRYHETIGELFRWATTDKYRSSLGERDDAR